MTVAPPADPRVRAFLDALSVAIARRLAAQTRAERLAEGQAQNPTGTAPAESISTP